VFISFPINVDFLYSYQNMIAYIIQAIIFLCCGAVCGVGFLSGGLSFFGVFRGVFFLFQIWRGGCFAAFLFAFALFKKKRGCFLPHLATDREQRESKPLGEAARTAVRAGAYLAGAG
jgi:hypothetical protein